MERQVKMHIDAKGTASSKAWGCEDAGPTPGSLALSVCSCDGVKLYSTDWHIQLCGDCSGDSRFVLLRLGRARSLHGCKVTPENAAEGAAGPGL